MNDDQEQAARDVVAIFDPYLSDDIGFRFSCTEVERLCAFLRLWGNEGGADVLMASHLEDDGDGEHEENLRLVQGK